LREPASLLELETTEASTAIAAIAGTGVIAGTRNNRGKYRHCRHCWNRRHCWNSKEQKQVPTLRPLREPPPCPKLETTEASLVIAVIAAIAGAKQVSSLLSLREPPP
jgi:hypothetical protein